jgi:hypothetical protein
MMTVITTSRPWLTTCRNKAAYNRRCSHWGPQDRTKMWSEGWIMVPLRPEALERRAPLSKAFHAALKVRIVSPRDTGHGCRRCVVMSVSTVKTEAAFSPESSTRRN